MSDRVHELLRIRARGKSEGWPGGAPGLALFETWDSTVASTLGIWYDIIHLLQARFFRTLKAMEVHFTPEQQAQIARVASKAGTVPERLVTNVVVRYLAEEARFLAAVEKGLVAAERGEFTKKKKWTPALKPCSRLDAHPMDRPRRR